jgi:hypothetical protein
LPQQHNTYSYTSAQLLDKAEILFKSFGEASIAKTDALASFGPEYGDDILAQLEVYNLIEIDTDQINVSSLAVRLLQETWEQTSSAADGILLGPSETAQYIAG